jgi:REP element-mobilizing transposase RayT
MAHTYSNHLYHIVFSTKERISLIKKEQKAELHAYISSLVNEKGGKILIINSMPDHVHMLIVLPPDIAVSDVLKFVKANSSRWMKGRFGKPFAWQKGFGSFTVSRSGVDAVAKYIRDQEIHHRKMDFRNEFVTFLAKNEVEFDEEFLWR